MGKRKKRAERDAAAVVARRADAAARAWAIAGALEESRRPASEIEEMRANVGRRMESLSVALVGWRCARSARGRRP